MEFRRGEIIQVNYYRSTCIGRHIAQEMCVKSNEDYYNVCWAILGNEDLFGVGDKVCFLVEHGEVINLRLDYCFKG